MQTDVILWHQNSLVSNQGIVSLEDIRGGSDLFCLTNSTMRLDPVGSWYHPDGTKVQESGSGFSHNRGRSFVMLTYSGSGSPPSGLYRCVIPDSSQQDVTMYVGIYENEQGEISPKLMESNVIMWCRFSY